MLNKAVVDGKCLAFHNWILSKINKDYIQEIIRNDQLLVTLGMVDMQKKEAGRYQDVSYTPL